VIEKIRSTKVDAGNLKHELLNRLRSTMTVNVSTVSLPLPPSKRH